MRVSPAFVVVGAALAAACVVREYCAEDRDCPGGGVCDAATGTCGVECEEDADCGGVGFSCTDHRCLFQCEGGDLACPADMVSVCGVFCMDRWEASRPDADAGAAGVDGSIATSREGVIPWYSSDGVSGINTEIATAACAAAGKRLCSLQEWRAVCRGTADTTYTYGDAYDPTTCNGIDAFCACDPYPGCYHACGADLHVVPTGSFPACVAEFGAYDVNGNVWELVDAGDGQEHYRGGAYNCSDSEKLHRCDYDAVATGSFPSARGFRCCADGEAAR